MPHAFGQTLVGLIGMVAVANNQNAAVIPSSAT